MNTNHGLDDKILSDCCDDWRTHRYPTVPESSLSLLAFQLGIHETETNIFNIMHTGKQGSIFLFFFSASESRHEKILKAPWNISGLDIVGKIFHELLIHLNLHLQHFFNSRRARLTKGLSAKANFGGICIRACSYFYPWVNEEDARLAFLVEDRGKETAFV